MQGTFEEIIRSTSLNLKEYPLYKETKSALEKGISPNFLTDEQMFYMTKLNEKKLFNLKNFYFLKNVDAPFYPYAIQFIQLNNTLTQESHTIAPEDSETQRALFLYEKQMLTTATYLQLENEAVKEVIDILRQPNFTEENQITLQMIKNILKVPQLFNAIMLRGDFFCLQLALNHVFINDNLSNDFKLEIITDMLVRENIRLNQPLLQKILENYADLYINYAEYHKNFREAFVIVCNKPLEAFEDLESMPIFPQTTQIEPIFDKFKRIKKLTFSAGNPYAEYLWVFLNSLQDNLPQAQRFFDSYFSWIENSKGEKTSETIDKTTFFNIISELIVCGLGLDSPENIALKLQAVWHLINILSLNIKTGHEDLVFKLWGNLVMNSEELIQYLFGQTELLSSINMITDDFDNLACTLNALSLHPNECEAMKTAISQFSIQKKIILKYALIELLEAKLLSNETVSISFQYPDLALLILTGIPDLAKRAKYLSVLNSIEPEHLHSIHSLSHLEEIFENFLKKENLATSKIAATLSRSRGYMPPPSINIGVEYKQQQDEEKGSETDDNASMMEVCSPKKH